MVTWLLRKVEKGLGYGAAILSRVNTDKVTQSRDLMKGTVSHVHPARRALQAEGLLHARALS